MTLVNVPRKQITPSKLVSAMLALVRSITGVGSHMASDMLWTSERSTADGTFVVTSHLGGKERRRRWSSVNSSCKPVLFFFSVLQNDVVVELR